LCKKLETLAFFGRLKVSNKLHTRSKEGFRVNKIIGRKLASGQRRIERRLDKTVLPEIDQPMFSARNIHYELADRVRGLAYGGIGAMHLLAQRLGLIDAIDNRLQLLKIHLPYHESDHVLNLAYNALCDGTCLQDLELRRNDEVFLDALGTQRIPDPTTAGDFCRRFHAADVHTLIDIINAVRQKVWARQTPDFFEQAWLDMDGTLVPTDGECKAGIDIAYDGTWGYQALVVSLGNTGEVLRVINRPGNRPSHEGAAAEVDRALQVCLEGGFRRVLLRGDTDFSQTTHLDGWAADPRVQFIFGLDVTAARHVQADDLPADAWQTLERPARYQVKTQPRRRPERVKESIIRARGFKNICLQDEEVAEFPYRPVACRQTYRMIVIRKNLAVEQGQQRVFDAYRYFFYLTNDWQSSRAEIVFLANDRCNQENLHAQLKGGVRALQAPLDTLESNWAYMVMVALAWNLKAWWALWPEDKPGRWLERHREEKQTVLRMEFQRFVNTFMLLPCQIVRTGRRLIYRLLSWNPWQRLLFRTLDALRC
jgi:Transposase DDE domain group 1